MPTGNTGFRMAGGGQGGWSSPGNVAAADGAFASASFLVTDFGGGNIRYDDTAQLQAVSFSATAVEARVVGVEVEINAKRDGTPDGATMHAQIFIDGNPSGNVKSFSLGTSAASTTLGSAGDNWGIAAINASYIGHLWVAVWATPTGSTPGAGTAYVDWVQLKLTYEQVNAFDFGAKLNQPLSTTVESVTQTISGITAPATVTVFGGEWRKNGGAYTSGGGTASTGDVLQVRHTTAGSHNSAVTTALTVGPASGFFQTVTNNDDTDPDAFSFSTTNGANPGTQIISPSVSITGINAPAPWSVTGAAIVQINGTNQPGSSGTLNNNDNVLLIGMSNGSFNGSASFTLTVGTISGTWTLNTRAADTIPDAYAWTNQSGVVGSTLITSNAATITGIEAAAAIAFSGLSNGTTVAPATSAYEYRINAGAWLACSGATPTISNGQTLQMRLGSNAGSGVAASITTSVGGVVRSWTVTTTTGDIVPDPFSFIDEPAAGVNSLITSNAVTITGIDAPSSLAFSGLANGTTQAPATHAYEYRIDGGAWLACSGATPTVTNGQTLQLRLGANGTIGVVAAITPSINGVSDTWSVTSAPPDVTPNPFTFQDVAGVDVNTLTVSAAVTITGINAPAAISIVNGEYSINGGAFTTAAGTVNNRDTVQVRVMSAATLSTTENTPLTVGGVSDTFSVTTRSPNLNSQYVITFRETIYGIDV